MTSWDADETGGGPDLQANFNRLSDLVSSSIRKIQNNVMSLERMVGQIGTDGDSETLRGKVHELTHSTNALAKDANRLLKDISNIADGKRQLKLEKDRLTNDLMAVLNNFQAAQRAAAQKEKDSLVRARANSAAASEAAAAAAEMGNGGPAPQTQMEANVDINAIKERRDQLQQLEEDIVGVNQIFKDLATMVHEQGDMVDSIESHVEVASQQVEAGSRNVQRASQYQTSARKKKLCCALLALILLVIIIIIIAVEVPKSKK